ncbi:peptidylprolyl isomerase [uncultured Clostridium sp.]|uniref:peptidylprolyl isomerase n=1 Tax=uncultured Clostridium sp. TaxID=59620 RepID=UPI00262E1B13|nr:peptidylprolyl isomerase [uncultured Clostridium sp.]
MENKILATVGSYEITEKELNDLIAKYPADRKAMVESEMGRKQLLEQMIQVELFDKLGKELKVNETNEYKEIIERLQKEILAQATIEKVLVDVTVTDDEIKAFYEANEDKFSEKATVSAKHILVENEEDAKKIREEILSGATSFEDAAVKYSSCPSKEQGGNLGAFGEGMMVPEFEKAAFEAELNEITEPVKTQFGYHLIKVESKNEAKTKEFEEVKAAVAQQLVQQAQQKKFMDTIKDLEAKYGVVRNS